METRICYFNGCNSSFTWDSDHPLNIPQGCAIRGDHEYVACSNIVKIDNHIYKHTDLMPDYEVGKKLGNKVQA